MSSCSSCVSIDQVIEFTEAIAFSDVRLVSGDTDITRDCRYSWSTDKTTWSCWTTYGDYTRQARQIDGDFFLRIVYRAAIRPAVYINNILVSCYTVSIYRGNPFLNDVCQITSNSGFDLYSGWDCALQMQQQLSDTVICMVGIPVYYFKVDPDVDTKSYTFKEYVLHSVQSVKQIKMMIADGAMPSSKPTLGEWDMDFETDWDTELSKTQFATAFGVDAFPKQRDFIWVPMQKRMYMVNAAYEEKNENLMWRAVTWKLSLVKWQDQDNIDQGDLESVIDSLIVNTQESAFAAGEEHEGELTGERVLASPTYSATNLYSVEDSDYIRKGITMNKIKITERQINHGSLVVTKHKYIPQDGAAVTYQEPYCGDEGTVSLVIDVPLNIDSSERNIICIGDWSLKYKNGSILWNGVEYSLETGDTYLIIIRWSRLMCLTDIKIVKHVAPVGVPAYKLKPTMYRFDFDTAVSNVTDIDNRLVSTAGLQVVLNSYPLQVAAFKVYNTYIGDDHLDEVLKYTTENKRCVICDLARPLLGDHGYTVV